MNIRYGRASHPRLSGDPHVRVAKAAPLAGASSRFALETGFDTYPNKYLRTGWQQRLAHRGAAAGRAATLPLSLLFPILVLLMISVTLRHERNDQEFDAQLILRLAGYSLAALSVFVALGMRRLRLEASVLACVLVPAFIAATALYAPEPMFALTAGVAHLALLLFAWRMVTRHGHTRAVFAFVVTGMIIGALSILVYFAFPDLGQSSANVSTGDLGGRMRGVADQPNSLGTISAVTVLLAIMYFKAFTARQRLVCVAAICIGAFCLYYSVSRTNVLAVLLCVGLWRLCRSNAAFKLSGVLGIALLACLLIGFVPDLSSHLSRAGARTDDLASFNGRTEIWAVAWENIKAHPILGQGYGSSGVILPHDDRLFPAAVNAHNVYLELLFSGGAVLLILYALAVSIALVRSAKDGRAEALVALLLFLILGNGQATPFGGLPLFPAAAFYTAVCLCLVRSNPQRQEPRRRVRSPLERGISPGALQRAPGGGL